MRSPTLLGALAGLALGTAVLVVLLVSAVSQDPRPPSPTAPSPPPIDSGLQPPASPSPRVTGQPSPTAGATVSASPAEGLGIGDRAPQIELPALDGGRLRTADYEGRPLWINFMATWCPACQEELPMMELMQEQLGDELAIVLVDVAEDEQRVEQFVESLGVTLPVGLDFDGSAQRQWGAYALPVHYWLDEDGIIRAKVFGGAPREIFMESVRTVVPEAELEQDE